MNNPRLPGISETEQNLLYDKLNEYNRGRASFKEMGSYLVVLPRPEKPNYTLWVFSPTLEKQSILYIHDLSEDIHQALRMASTMLYFSPRCLLITEYNEKRMQSNGEDIIAFGKYHGHYLHEILKIDPTYLSWIAYKYTPRIPKQERFVKMAQVYHSVHLDLMQRKIRQAKPVSSYLADEGEKVTNITLKVLRVRLEDDPYKTRINGMTPQFYVRQLLTLTDANGRLITMRLASKHPSTESCALSSMEHAYHPEEMIYIESAQVSHTYEVNGTKYTRLNRVKLSRVSIAANQHSSIG